VVLLRAARAVAVFDNVRGAALPTLMGLFDHRTGWTGEPRATSLKQRVPLRVEPLPCFEKDGCSPAEGERSPRVQEARVQEAVTALLKDYTCRKLRRSLAYIGNCPCGFPRGTG
jgi:hypothetical protein